MPELTPSCASRARWKWPSAESQAGKKIAFASTQTIRAKPLSVGLWAQRTDVGMQLCIGLKGVSKLLAIFQQSLLVLRPDVGECLGVRGLKP